MNNGKNHGLKNVEKNLKNNYKKYLDNKGKFFTKPLSYKEWYEYYIELKNERI